jgi:hypothetical protein
MTWKYRRKQPWDGRAVYITISRAVPSEGFPAVKQLAAPLLPPTKKSMCVSRSAV